MKIKTQNNNILVYNKWLPFKGFMAINLFTIIFIRQELADRFTLKSLNHEKIHSAQMAEVGYLLYYPAYLIEWLIKKVVFGKYAYQHISFEQEAYMYEENLHYLDYRKRYNWAQFICQ